MKRLIFLPLLLFACAGAAAPPSTSPGDETARISSDAARISDETARAGDDAAHQTDEQKLADLQKRMNDLARRMAELSTKAGDQASASALRYLADGKRGMLGIVLDRDSAGLRVGAVTPDGPAERAGIRDGDVITAIDGKPLHGGDMSRDDLVAGKPVTLAVLRDGKTLQFHVTPERFQAADWQALARTAQAAAQRSLNSVNSPEFRKRLDRSIEEAMKQTARARGHRQAPGRLFRFQRPLVRPVVGSESRFVESATRALLRCRQRRAGAVGGRQELSGTRIRRRDHRGGRAHGRWSGRCDARPGRRTGEQARAAGGAAARQTAGTGLQSSAQLGVDAAVIARSQSRSESRS